MYEIFADKSFRYQENFQHASNTPAIIPATLTIRHGMQEQQFGSQKFSNLSNSQNLKLQMLSRYLPMKVFTTYTHKF